MKDHGGNASKKPQKLEKYVSQTSQASKQGSIININPLINHNNLYLQMNNLNNVNNSNINLSNNSNGVNFPINYNPPTVNDRSKPKTTDKNLREREEGFSVYIMGANEERMKNIRKKEQIEKSKNRSNQGSKSIVTRKKWDMMGAAGNQAGPRPEKGSIERTEVESRSKTRARQDLKSPGVDYKAVSKLIMGEPKSHSNSKHFPSKETQNNLEEMLHNINSMNKNVISNLNRLGIVESPINSGVNLKNNSSFLVAHTNNVNSNSTQKRKRNWDQPKYGMGIVYPEFSSSVENSEAPNKLKNNHLKIEIPADNSQNSQFSQISSSHLNQLSQNNLSGNNKNFNFKNNCNIQELGNYEEEMDSLEEGVSCEGELKLNHLESYNNTCINNMASLNSRSGGNSQQYEHMTQQQIQLTHQNRNEAKSPMNIDPVNINSFNYLNMSHGIDKNLNKTDLPYGLLKNSNSSLTVSRIDLLMGKKENSNFTKLNSCKDPNLYWGEKNDKNDKNDKFSQIETHQNQNNNLSLSLSGGKNFNPQNSINSINGNNNINMNVSNEQLNKKEMLVLDNMDSSDLINLSNNVDNLNFQNFQNLQNLSASTNTGIKMLSFNNSNHNHSLNAQTQGISGPSSGQGFLNILSSTTEKNKKHKNSNSNSNSNTSNLNNKNRTKSANKSFKPLERPFSSVNTATGIGNNSKLKSNEQIKNKEKNVPSSSVHNQNENILNVNNLQVNPNTIKNTNNVMIPSIQFIYKSPQNKTKNYRPLSHIQKAKSSISQVNTIGIGIGVTPSVKFGNNINNIPALNNLHNLSSLNNINHLSNITNLKDFQNAIADRFSSREQINSNLNRNRKDLKDEFTSITQSGVNFSSSTTNKKKKNSSGNSSYPIISNIQQVNKFPIKEINTLTTLTHSKEKDRNYNPTINTGNKKSSTKKRVDLLSKIEQFDDKKLKKLARVVEELANYSDEQSELSLLENPMKSSSKNVQNMIFNNIKDKFNINYIKADSVNFGNININLNNNGNSGNILENSASATGKSSFTYNASVKDIRETRDNRNKDYRDHRDDDRDKIEKKNYKVTKDDFDNFINDEEKSPKFNSDNLGVCSNSGTGMFSSAVTVNPFSSKKNSSVIHANILRSPSSSPISNFSVISIIILTTWGNQDRLGLTEIQILDSKNKKIDIIECHVFNGNEDNINKLLNCRTFTVDENDMWQTNYSQGLQVKIEVYFEAFYEVDKILIWNYNGRDLTKGVKDIEIFKRNNFVYRGTINKGIYSVKNDYCTKINLSQHPSGSGLGELLSSANLNHYNNFSNSNLNSVKYNFELSNVLLDSSEGDVPINLLSGDKNKSIQSQENSKIYNNDSKLLREDLTSPNEDEVLLSSNKIMVNRKDRESQCQGPQNSSKSSKLVSTHTSHIPTTMFSNPNLNSARNQISSMINKDLIYENILRTSIGNSNPTNNFNNILCTTQGLQLQDEINLNLNLFSQNNQTLKNIQNLQHIVICSRIKLILTSNHGDFKYIGLTGLQLLDENLESINIERAKTIGAMPKDINTIFNNCGDPRIFENIFNNVNETSDEYNMWLTQHNSNSPSYIELSFETPINLSGLKFWNFNCPGQLERGAKSIELILDENYSNQQTVILRKGISEDNLDFSQTFLFPIMPPNLTEEEIEKFRCPKPASLVFSQDYETPYLPTGFIFKLTLISTHGDPHYIGLNGIEFYDSMGNNVFNYDNMDETQRKPKNNYNPKIMAIPSGVHQLEGMEEDQRVIQNLLTGSNVWLSPFINTHGVIDNLENTFSNFNKNTNLNNKPNCIYFIFDKPVSVSYIQIWNYSKKPERGVKEIHISCDDNLIYKGYLKKKEETVILFTSDKMITKNINESSLTDSNSKNEYKYLEQQNSYIMHLDSNSTQYETCQSERPLTLEK